MKTNSAFFLNFMIILFSVTASMIGALVLKSEGIAMFFALISFIFLMMLPACSKKS